MMINKKKTFAFAVMLFCFVGIIASFSFILKWKVDAKEHSKIQDNIAKHININKEEVLNIHFDELKKINSDTVAYLKVPNTNVDYVVVKGKDNDYYLKHDFYHNESYLGWIFVNYKNRFDGTDPNIVIFGHDTSDGSMFGSLSYLLNEEHIKNEDNLIIDFYTEQGLKKYQIFSIYTIEPETYYIETNFKGDDFEKFKEKVRDRSIFPFNAELENKNIITLSTCQDYGAKRLAIHAVEI